MRERKTKGRRSDKVGLRLHYYRERTKEMRERNVGDGETKWETTNEGERIN